MSDEALRDMAANRGCKLVRSRMRTPGRGDYGRYGLKDSKTGGEIFGFGKKGLTATPEEIETFLRGDAASAWKTSVGKAKRPPKAKPAPKPEPQPEPKLALRDARAADGDAIAALIAALGYDVTAADVRRRLGAVPAIVAEKGAIVGVLTMSMMTVLHRPKPVGRISMLVVEDKARGGGIGAALVAEAEKRLAAKGCGLVEVTSNRKRLRAHAFYARLGYERTSYRFGKALK